MNKTRKTLVTLLVLGVVGTLAGVGTFSAFSSTTDNTGNTFAAGTVYLADNDAGSAMYNVTNQKPGDVTTKCIRLTYTGSLAANVKLYTSSTVNALGTYVDLSIDKGTMPAGAFPGCTGFTADAGGPIFNNTLSNFTTTKNSYANGISAFPGAQTSWAQNDTVVYRFTLTLQDNNLANGGASALTTGSHDFTWEARNQ
jgi:predicted ribosomally synthesized peptide with SipW-like signal peptide